MRETDGGGAALKAIAVVAIALAGLVASLTPLGPRLEDMVLDGEWRLLRAFAPREAPDDIVIVGVDPATVAAIPEPPPLWHASLGLALARIASSRPRAIALELALPERSYEGLRPGLDRAFLTGLAAAAQNGPFIAALAIDARTRSARQVYAPYLALLGSERLGNVLGRQLRVRPAVSDDGRAERNRCAGRQVRVSRELSSDVPFGKCC